MLKIANSPVQRCSPLIGGATYLPFSDVSQGYVTAATAALIASGLQTWKTANPDARITALTPETGMDGVTGLLYEYTAIVTADLPNSSLVQEFISAESSADLEASLDSWQTTNSTFKPYRISLIIGNDGSTGYLIEYTTSTSYTGPKNSSLTRLLFTDSEESPAYEQYEAWRILSANISKKPLFLIDSVYGIMIYYTFVGTFPSAGQILQNAISNDDLTSDADTELQDWKDDNPTYSVLRVTTTCNVILVEYCISGSTPNNTNIQQSYYEADTENPTANTAYQVFKTANPTLIPVRTTKIIWGDGTTGILAEYIS